MCLYGKCVGGQRRGLILCTAENGYNLNNIFACRETERIYTPVAGILTYEHIVKLCPLVCAGSLDIYVVEVCAVNGLPLCVCRLKPAACLKELRLFRATGTELTLISMAERRLQYYGTASTGLRIGTGGLLAGLVSEAGDSLTLFIHGLTLLAVLVACITESRTSGCICTLDNGLVLGVIAVCRVNSLTYRANAVYVAVRGHLHGFLCLKNRLTYRALLTFGKTCFDTGCAYRRNGLFGMTACLNDILGLGITAVFTCVGGITVLCTGGCGHYRFKAMIGTNYRRLDLKACNLCFLINALTCIIGGRLNYIVATREILKSSAAAKKLDTCFVVESDSVGSVTVCNGYIKVGVYVENKTLTLDLIAVISCAGKVEADIVLSCYSAGGDVSLVKCLFIRKSNGRGGLDLGRDDRHIYFIGRDNLIGLRTCVCKNLSLHLGKICLEVIIVVCYIANRRVVLKAGIGVA